MFLHFHVSTWRKHVEGVLNVLFPIDHVLHQHATKYEILRSSHEARIPQSQVMNVAMDEFDVCRSLEDMGIVVQFHVDTEDFCCWKHVAEMASGDAHMAANFQDSAGRPDWGLKE